jgi:hypothetical protein
MGQVRGFHRCQLRACASTCSPFISCNTVSFFAQFVMSPDYVRTPASFRCVSRHYLPHGVAATVPRRTKNLVGYTARYRSTSFLLTPRLLLQRTLGKGSYHFLVIRASISHPTYMHLIGDISFPLFALRFNFLTTIATALSLQSSSSTSQSQTMHPTEPMHDRRCARITHSRRHARN